MKKLPFIKLYELRNSPCSSRLPINLWTIIFYELGKTASQSILNIKLKSPWRLFKWKFPCSRSELNDNFDGLESFGSFGTIFADLLVSLNPDLWYSTVIDYDSSIRKPVYFGHLFMIELHKIWFDLINNKPNFNVYCNSKLSLIAQRSCD